MQSDSLTYDSIPARPLPKWLIDQKEGHCEIKPTEITMKEDSSLQISFAFTAVFIIVIVIILSLYITSKFRKE